MSTTPPRDPGSTTKVTGPPQTKVTGPPQTKVTGAYKGQLSPKTLELGRSFLSALFMGLRTAQIHDSSNRAFERAVQSVRVSADSLFAATGGFTISFVDESVFLNGLRLRFDSGVFDTMRTLRHILESKELGGIEMRGAPSYDAIRKLILLFSQTPAPAEQVSTEDLSALQIGVLGVQRFSDQSRDGIKVDRRVFAVQCYAKLLLAFREQRAQMMNPERSTHAPRLRAVRVVQDLVELCGDRADFLLRLGSNRTGAAVDELHAVNVSVLSVAIGYAIGLARQDLVDLGVGALLHDVGRSDATEPPLPEQQRIRVGAEEEAPVEYDGVLELASDSWGDSRAEHPFAGDPDDDRPRETYSTEDNSDEEAPPPLPIEFLGELQPLDPADASSEADDSLLALDIKTLDGLDDEGGDATPMDPEALEVAGDSTILSEKTDETRADDVRDTEDIPPALRDRKIASPEAMELLALLSEDTRVEYVGPYHPPEEDGRDDVDPLASGRPGHPEETLNGVHRHTFSTLARMLVAGRLSRAGLTRAVIGAEHHAEKSDLLSTGEPRPPAHLFSRIVALADAYDALTSGLGSEDGIPNHPIDTLEVLQNDRSGRIDPRLVDVLINVLRAFPVGTAVVLDNGEHGVVSSHAGGTRWDRPVVRTLSKNPRSIDLMARTGDRFVARIIGTVRFVGDDAERV